MNKFNDFTADYKQENAKQKTKYDNQTWWNFCGKKNDQGEVKNLTFRWLNLLLMFILEEVKKKNGEAYKPEILKKKLQSQIYWVKTSLNFLDKFSNAEESSCWSNIEKERIFGKRSVPGPPRAWVGPRVN